MSTGSWIWAVIYGIAALAFFVVAAGITVFGIRDMRSLLSGSERRKKNDDT